MENDVVVTDYIGISNLQSLFNHDNNAGSLNIELSNLDKDFEYFQLVILSNNQQQIVAKIIGSYSTQQSSITIDYIDPATLSLILTINLLQTKLKLIGLLLNTHQVITIKVETKLVS